MRRWKAWLTAAVCTLAVLLPVWLWAGLSAPMEHPPVTPPPVSTAENTPLLEDAEELVALIEESHPAFALGQVPEGYETAKTAFFEAAARPGATPADFALAAMVYTSALKDSHTRVDPFGGTPQRMLDVAWTAADGRLLLLDERGAPSGAEVTAVGGLPTEALFARLDLCTAAENPAGRARNRELWSRYLSILALFGASISEEGTVALTVLEDGVEWEVAVTSSVPAQVQQPVISTEWMGDVFYVDFNQCMPGVELDKAAGALRQAVADGCAKVILDVRGNGGGNSLTCEELLGAMGMTPPRYGGYIRYSPLARQERGYDVAEGGMWMAPDASAAVGNPAVDLVVLTDAETFSSATMLGVFVQDGGLGTIVGRPSCNAPSSFGDILSFRLSNTGLSGSISHKQWLRPDEGADPTLLHPDVETAVGEDALQRGLTLLAEQ